jgi:hypothetical protein
MPRVKCKNATSITLLQIICSHKLTTPGVEPGLSRPRRDVLTTRRCGRLNASRQRSSTHTTIYRNSTGSAHVPRWPMSRLKAHSIHLARIERQVTTHRGKLKKHRGELQLRNCSYRTPSCNQVLPESNVDPLGFEPRAFRMRSGCDTTTP